jgi:hypothetical protein
MYLFSPSKEMRHLLNSAQIKIVLQDDHLPLHVDKSSEVEQVLEVVWISSSEKDEIVQCVLSRYMFLVPYLPLRIGVLFPST